MEQFSTRLLLFITLSINEPFFQCCRWSPLQRQGPNINIISSAWWYSHSHIKITSHQLRPWINISWERNSTSEVHNKILPPTKKKKEKSQICLCGMIYCAEGAGPKGNWIHRDKQNFFVFASNFCKMDVCHVAYFTANKKLISSK